MRRFAKNDNQAICNYCGKWQSTDLTNQQLEEMDWKCDECKAKENPQSKPQEVPTDQDRGSKEVSKYDPSYIFLVTLVKLLVKEGVSPQEIKSIAAAHPFVTVDDVGDLTAKLWTLATEKYQIPREWLIKRLPKNASLDVKAREHLDPIDTRREYNKKTPKKVEPYFSAADRLEIEDPFQDIENQRIRFPKKKANKKYRPPFEDLLRMITDGYIQDDWAFEPCDINTGMCENFVYNVRKVYPEAKEVGIRMEKPNGPFHTVLRYNGKFYDSETPDGVNNLRDIQFVQQWPKNTPLYTDNSNGLTAKQADLWPAQEEAEDMLDHHPGYLAYEYGQDKTSKNKSLNLDKAVEILNAGSNKVVSINAKDHTVTMADGAIMSFDDATKAAADISKTADGFTGAEFSTDDFGVNPTMDIGPWSSPEDQGARPQKSPFPNTGWLPADDDNLDEQPSSNVASTIKRPFSKKANPDSRYWISPDGTEYNAGTHHGAWIKLNKDLLNQQGINTSTIGYAWDSLIKNGWARVSNEPAGTGFQIQVDDLKHVPQFLDGFVSRNFMDGNVIEMGDQSGNLVRISDPFPSIQKAVNRALRMKQTASLKQADLSGQTVNQIVNELHSNGGATWNLSKGNMAGTDNYAVSIYPDRAQILDGVDFDRVEEFIASNHDLLDNPENSFGAWTHDGKVYMDVVATVPDVAQAVELGKQHNQIAIWDLKNAREIQTGGTGEVKQAVQKQILPQQLQDEVAAETSPVYNIALNNYAEAVKRGHEKDRSLEYAIESVANLEKIDPKKFVELINKYL
jgi:hypothetical protein